MKIDAQKRHYWEGRIASMAGELVDAARILRARATQAADVRLLVPPRQAGRGTGTPTHAAQDRATDDAGAGAGDDVRFEEADYGFIARKLK